MDGPPENDICSICHSNFNTPCQANCSHWFCVVYYKFGIMDPPFTPVNVLYVDAKSPCWFPVKHHLGNATWSILQRSCRELKDITVDLVNSQMVSCRAKFEEYMEYVQQISDLHSSLLVRTQDLPFLLRRLLRDIRDPQRTLPLFIRARVYLAMVASAIYVLSPVDIIPEGLLGIIGFLDDLIIILMCFLHVAALYRAVLLSRHGGS